MFMYKNCILYRKKVCNLISLKSNMISFNLFSKFCFTYFKKKDLVFGQKIQIIEDFTIHKKNHHCSDDCNENCYEYK